MDAAPNMGGVWHHDAVSLAEAKRNLADAILASVDAWLADGRHDGDVASSTSLVNGWRQLYDDAGDA